MKIEDAAKILNIAGDVTPETIKKAYRQACMKYHPDRNPAGKEMMQAINAAYEVLKDYEGTIKQSESEEFNGQYDEALNAALNVVVAIVGLNVEICGAWVWVTGNTKPHKEALKAAGFWWAKKKEAWYFRPEDWKSANRGSWDMDKIRDEHGSVQVRGSTRKQLQATA